jgi:hypothetical protein
MPRTERSNLLADVVLDAMEPVLKRASAAIARAMSDMAAQRLESELARGGKGNGRRVAGARRPRKGAELTRWVADRRARRVPTFVIELTGGLDTKKKIVAKYGEGAVFERGKPAPKAK